MALVIENTGSDELQSTTIRSEFDFKVLDEDGNILYMVCRQTLYTGGNDHNDRDR